MREHFFRWAHILRGVNRRQAAAHLALALILALALGLRLRVIEEGMPYPQHVDETFLTDNGARILKTGDFNPHFFMYPSLPIYLTAAAMTLGYLDAAGHAELRTTADIGLVGYPYYQHPRVVRPARWLFALISVFALLFLARVARATGGHLAMVLAPAWLALSSLYFEQSQTYLNVNIVGCAFTWCTLWLVLKRLELPDWISKVVFPGLLCGMVIACKYNFFAVVLAPLLAIFWYGGGRRKEKALALLALTGATFLLCAPYTLLDFKGFLDDLGRITYDYSEGSFFGTPETATLGSHLLLYLEEMKYEFGTASFLFVLAGAVVLVRRDLKLALIVSLPPVVLLLQTSSLPTHFMRNLLPFLPFWALLGALGLKAAIHALGASLERQPRLAGWPPIGRYALAALCVLAPTSFFVPLEAPPRWLSIPLTSRQKATTWLLENVPKERPLIVARELGLHPGPLRKAGFTLTEIPLVALSSNAFLAELAKAPDALVLLPKMISDHWDAGTIAAGEQLLPQIELFHQEIEPIRTFGRDKVSVCFEFPTGGDPEFVVGKPRRSAAELAAMARGHFFPGRDFQGEMTQVQAMGLAILAHHPVASPPLELEAGAFRASINATGSPANGLFPVVRVRFGELELGQFVAGDLPGTVSFDFELEAPTEASFVLELINDEVERDAGGKIVADRNVRLQGLFVHPHPPGAAS